MIFKGSIGRKYAMALSAFFLLIFLLQHFLINFLSVFSPDSFNEVSHFMGTNPLVQFLLQPILIAGVVFHFVMGFILEIQNKKARGSVGYAYNKPSQNSTWFSRNMILSGAVILAFLILHMYGFWWHEMDVKYITPEEALINDSERYYADVVSYFKNPVYVGLYLVSFVLLGMHLLHGFQSAFQSVGARHPKYTPTIQKLGQLYGILIPVGFAFIAVYHFLVS